MAIDLARSNSYLPLRDAMERLFDGSFIAPGPMDRRLTSPPANMRVGQDAVEIELGVPGFNPDDIDISITGDTVTVSGEAKGEQRERKGQVVIEEIWKGRFQRSFILPFPVSRDDVKATIDNGVLRLTLPRSESSKPHKIEVKHQNAQEHHNGDEKGTNIQHIQKDEARSGSEAVAGAK